MTKSKLNEQRSMETESRPTEKNSTEGAIISNNNTSDRSSAMVLYEQPSNHSSNNLSSQGGPSTPSAPVTSPTYIQINNNSYSYQEVVAPNAIVPHRQKWKEALGTLNTAVQIASATSNLCSIL